MKLYAYIALAILCWSFSACTSSTEFGACVGVGDDKNPELVYKVSKWNAFLGIIFIETIIVPIWILVDETMCPVARRE